MLAKKTSNKGNFIHSKNSFKTYDTTFPLQSLRYFVPIKRKGS